MDCISSSEKYDKRNLEITNFPLSMDVATIAKFVSHLGAIVLNMKRRNRSRKVYVQCTSEEHASDLMSTVHQLRVHESVLSVRYYDSSKVAFKRAPNYPTPYNVGSKSATKTHTLSTRVTQEIDGGGGGSTSSASPHRLHYPINGLLQYDYPKPNYVIIKNIAEALSMNSAFYTQVLHLMNKMNLPAPFVEREEPIILPTVAPAIATSQLSTDESELSTDCDAKPKTTLDTVPRLTRKRKQTGRLRGVEVAKKSRPHGISAPSTEQAFESIDKATTPVNIHLPSLTKLTEVKNTEVAAGGFGRIIPTPRVADKQSDSSDEDNELLESDFISSKELRRGRIHIDDLEGISAFRKYERGAPTLRLYIKNLAKQVTEKDMRYIYGRYVNWSDDLEKQAFDIQLMQKGRMKGQCFITLPNERRAAKAQRETHTFELLNKPMAVSFARSQKPAA